MHGPKRLQEKIYKNHLPPHISESNHRIIESAGPRKRLYQAWKGNNRFFLGGRMIFGPDVRSMMLTVFLIVVPVVLFAVFVSQKLVNEFEHYLGDLIVVIAVTVTICVLVLLLLTSGRDPGIIPRNAHPPELEVASSCFSADWTGNQGGGSTLPPTKDVLVNNVLVKVKYCNTCMLYRPPRCSHCSICNNCVERFDHHCPWVGQCIGKRNYRFFFMFVSSTTVLCLYVCSFCCINLSEIMDAYDCNLWTAILMSPVSGILIIYTFIAAWFVGGLTAFHSYLICSNQTTYENFRYRYDGKLNPYNRGCPQNVKEIFFSRIPASKNDFRAKMKEERANFNSSHSLGRVLSKDIAKTSFDLDNYNSPRSLGRLSKTSFDFAKTSFDIAKTSFDLEMGGMGKTSFDFDMGGLIKTSFEFEMSGKRPPVVAEEFEDLHSQIESMGGLERCGTQPPHSTWGSDKGNWGMTDDIDALAAEFGGGHGFTDLEKNIK